MMTLLMAKPFIQDPTMIFFVVLLIILLAPIIMGKLRIPHIIGMVLAGVLVGPFGLNVLERGSSFEIFGQVGLYYIMFLAGLEMYMESVKKNTRQFLIFGLQIITITRSIRLGDTDTDAASIVFRQPFRTFDAHRHTNPHDHLKEVGVQVGGNT